MIEIVDLAKEYRTETGKVRALDGISLTVGRGQRIGVLGDNGSGKSTLIRLVGGVELPTSGKIQRHMSVSWPLAYRGGLHQDISGYGNLRFLSRIYDRPYDELCAYVQDFTELGQRLRDPVYTYSSGMRAKLSFAISFAIEFDCYLIDEIIAVGDQRFRRKCREELFEKRQDRALLMVSHQVGTVEQACDIGILIKDGRHIDTFDIKGDREWRQHAKRERNARQLLS
jgi:capsular polysaccharide transport system ATP-binding protein